MSFYRLYHRVPLKNINGLYLITAPQYEEKALLVQKAIEQKLTEQENARVLLCLPNKGMINIPGQNNVVVDNDSNYLDIKGKKFDFIVAYEASYIKKEILLEAYISIANFNIPAIFIGSPRIVNYKFKYTETTDFWVSDCLFKDLINNSNHRHYSFITNKYPEKLKELKERLSDEEFKTTILGEWVSNYQIND